MTYGIALPMIRFSQFQFHPVVHLPSDYEVYDFTKEYDPNRSLKSPFGIGRYNEKRQGMYTQELFRQTRNIHMGIDIGAPVGTPVHAFFDGEIFLTGNNDQPGDYGFTIITYHNFEGETVYALHGHLAKRSIQDKTSGTRIKSGDVIGWIGDKSENGGWNPHLHFQLSYKKPEVCDMPGVVAEKDRESALAIYPDPRLVLGPLY
jgi:murein DD-endopeptidase MepM/ murein hydrolase activator NlpD